MTKQYEISVKDEKGMPTLNFSNNTNEFVEVVFTVNGQDIKTGLPFTGTERGFCYPDHYRQHIKKVAPSIRIKEGDQVRAYIYRGEGKYQKIDYDIPPFIRRKIGEGYPAAKKVIFKRFSNTPAQSLDYVV